MIPCSKDKLGFHDFRTIADHEKMVAEECRFCGHVEQYNKKNGRIDNSRYLEEHKKDFAQPNGRTRKLFLELYGDDSIKKLIEMNKRKTKQPTIEEIQGEAKEYNRFLQRLETRGYGIKELKQQGRL